METQLASRLMALPSESPVSQHAATLEPQACWTGTATVVIVSLEVRLEDGSSRGNTYGRGRSGS